MVLLEIVEISDNQGFAYNAIFYMSVFKMRTRNVFVLLFHRQKNGFCRLFFDYRCKDSKNSAKYKVKKVQKFKKCKVQEVKVGG